MNGASPDARENGWSLDGHVAVVTGGAKGIGRAVVTSFAEAGADVMIGDVDVEAGSAAAREIAEQTGSQVGFHELNVVDEGQVADIAVTARSELGPVSVWVNNAGIVRPAMLHKMSLEDFEVVVQVHVKGTFLGMREAARRMQEAGIAGTIINVTSAAGLQGTVGQVNYAAAKGAITAMTKSGARELGRYGIRVNAVAPVAATEMTEKVRSDAKLSASYLARIPLGRWAEPVEVANAFRYLAASASAYTTGQVLSIDGGMYMVS